MGDLTLAASDTLVNANAELDPATSPLNRGLQTLGRFVGALSDAITWVVQELQLEGTGGVSGLHTALRSRAILSNSGDVDQAEVHAADFEVINETGTQTKPAGRLVGVRATLTNDTGGYADEAVALEVGTPVNDGDLNDFVGLLVPDLDVGSVSNHAIKTGKGPVQLGDYIELIKPPDGTPGAGETNVVRVYAKPDGKLYAKDWNGIEHDLTGAGDGGSGGLLNPSAVMLYDNELDSAGSWDVSNISQDYDHLLLRIWGRGDATALAEKLYVYFNGDTTDTNYWYNYHGNANSTLTGGENDGPFCGWLTADTSPSNSFGYAEIQIPFYNLTASNKVARSYASARLTADAHYDFHVAFEWESTAAINQVTVVTDNDPTDEWLTGSRLQIIGIKESSEAEVGNALARIPQAYIAGMEVQCDGGTGNVIDIEAGVCRSDNDTYTMILSSTAEVNTGTSGAGGLDSGSLAADTHYAVWMIAKSSDGTTSAMISTSYTSPTMPSDYDKKRRVGSIVTDSSGDIKAQVTIAGEGSKRQVIYHDPQQTINQIDVSDDPTWNTVDFSSVVPPTSRFIDVTCRIISPVSPPTNAVFNIAYREKGVTSGYHHLVYHDTDVNYGEHGSYRLPVNSSQLGEVTDLASAVSIDEDFSMHLTGYVDNLLPTFVGSSSAGIPTQDILPITEYADLSTLLTAAPAVAELGVTIDHRQLFLWDGTEWFEFPFSIHERSTLDMGAVEGSSRNGYGPDYVTDKSLHNMRLLQSTINAEGGIRTVPQSTDPPKFQVYLRDAWNDILYDLTTQFGDLRHIPLSEPIQVFSGNSIVVGLNGLPVVQQYQVSMGALPDALTINGGIF